MFDDRGRPVRTVTPDTDTLPWSAYGVVGRWIYQSTPSTDGRDRWNVYPLRAVESENIHWDDTGRKVSSDAKEMPWPFAKASGVESSPAPTSDTGTSLQSADGTAS